MKRILVLDDTRTFQPCEGLELVHVRTVEAAEDALCAHDFDELWLDYHLEWNHPKPYEEVFHSGARLANWLHRRPLSHMIVRIISDLDERYIQKIIEPLDDAGYTYTRNPDGVGLPTPYQRTY